MKTRVSRHTGRNWSSSRFQIEVQQDVGGKIRGRNVVLDRNRGAILGGKLRLENASITNSTEIAVNGTKSVRLNGARPLRRARLRAP